MKLNHYGYQVELDPMEEDGSTLFTVESVTTDGATTLAELGQWLIDNALAIEKAAYELVKQDARDAA